MHDKAITGCQHHTQGKRSRVSARILLSLPLVAFLGACSTLGSSSYPTEVGAGGVPVAAERHEASGEDAELLAFVATGAPGTQGTVLSEQQGMLQAAIGSEYVSARGRLCRHLTLWGGASGQPSQRIACQNETGWELIRPLRGLASR
ncbi:MAG TPA: hypothetical protein VKY54_12460 [Kiloniellales bacterium]|nr:hypothetical protein [Kiloniellales bacterium]